MISFQLSPRKNKCNLFKINIHFWLGDVQLDKLQSSVSSLSKANDSWVMTENITHFNKDSKNTWAHPPKKKKNKTPQTPRKGVFSWSKNPI